MSNAISAQGTTFAIQAAAAGSAKNITAISKASPVVVTSNAHGLSVGDVVDLAAIGGMIELNGRTAIVELVTANTFSLTDATTGIPIDSTSYTTYTTGGTATPKGWVQSLEHKTYAFAPAARAEIDKTTLISTAKEFTAGLKDYGSFTAGLNIVKADAFQIRAKAALSLQDLWFRIVDPLGVATVFKGLVKSFGESGGVDAIADGSIEVRVTGEIIEAA